MLCMEVKMSEYIERLKKDILEICNKYNIPTTIGGKKYEVK